MLSELLQYDSRQALRGGRAHGLFRRARPRLPIRASVHVELALTTATKGTDVETHATTTRTGGGLHAWMRACTRCVAVPRAPVRHRTRRSRAHPPSPCPPRRRQKTPRPPLAAGSHSAHNSGASVQADAAGASIIAWPPVLFDLLPRGTRLLRVESAHAVDSRVGPKTYGSTDVRQKIRRIGFDPESTRSFCHNQGVRFR